MAREVLAYGQTPGDEAEAVGEGATAAAASAREAKALAARVHELSRPRGAQEAIIRAGRSATSPTLHARPRAGARTARCS